MLSLRKAPTEPLDPTESIARTLAKLGVRPRPQYIGAVEGPRGHRLYYQVEPECIPGLIKGEAALATGLALASAIGQGGRPLRVGADRFFFTADLPTDTPAHVPVDPFTCHQINLNRPERLAVEIGVEGYGLIESATDPYGNPVYRAVRPPRVRLELGSQLVPHCFGGGTTGAGKTGLERVIMALLALHNDPALVRMVAMDSKNRTFEGPLATLPHLVWAPATSAEESNAALRACNAELHRREREGAGGSSQDPYWVLFIDELADLDQGELWPIVRKGRELRMIVVAFSQRLAGDIAKGVADQFPGRMCGRVAPRDYQTSQAIIGSSDALASHGNGDWFAVLGNKHVRFQAAYAALNDAHGAPDDPFWTSARWSAVTPNLTPDPIPAKAPKIVSMLTPPHPSQAAKLPTRAEIMWAVANRWDDEDGTPRSAGVEVIIAHLKTLNDPCGVVRAQRIRDAAQLELDEAQASAAFRPSGLPPRPAPRVRVPLTPEPAYA